MREILFKAKKIGDGEWVEGYYFAKPILEKHFIILGENQWMIDRSTLSQYTGLTDKNGNKIWENDIVRFKHGKVCFDDELFPWEKTCLLNKEEYTRNYIVEFCNTPTHYGLRLRNCSIWFMVHKMTILMHDAEVIGNIFDNPELMEVK